MIKPWKALCTVNGRVPPDTFQENTVLENLDPQVLKCVPRNREFCRSGKFL